MKKRTQPKKTQPVSTPEIPRTFKDAEGRTWRPKLTTSVLVEACRALGIEIKDLIDQSINVGDMIEFIWYTCREQAEDRKMLISDFYDGLTLPILPSAFLAVIGTVKESFPQSSDMLMQAAQKFGSGPFASGQSTTSSSSVDEQE